MVSGLATLAPLFVGPSVALIGTLLAIVVVLVIARVLIGLAWKLVVIGAIILSVLWLLGAVSVGPPGFG
jgi:hypothetical protein